MEKNKILEAARKNKNIGREYEKKEFMKSNVWGSIVSMILGIILFLIEYFAKGSINISLIAVGLTLVSVQAVCEGIKSKKIHLIIIGAVQAIMALIAILVFFIVVVKR